MGRTHRALYLSITPKFKKGDPPPQGYMEWHEWAGVQYRAGLRQKRCSRCARWLFPQQVPTHVCKPPIPGIP